MSSDPLATLVDVGKQYVKYEDVPTLLTGVRHLMKRGRRGRLWAVRHLDLEVGRGDSIGIIGRNGSGKSTTLAMLAGVTAPTEGIVRVRGRIAPLLQLGVGFDLELTGRENVFINGHILGMSSNEIRRAFDEIVAFAEMADFIDTPVKFYSSGMVVRLGFAAAVAAEPDLLIVDEVLAVGDVAFQMRSFDRMLAMRERGTTIVVVSHNMASIRRLTDNVIVLHHGEVRYEGTPSDGISLYHDLLRESVATGDVDPADVVRVLSFDMHAADGRPTANVPTGEEVTFRMHVRFATKAEDAVFGVAIATEAGQFVYAENSIGSIQRDYSAGEEHIFKVTLPMRLNSGSYTASCGVTWGSLVKQTVNSPAKVFYVSGRPLSRGIVDLGARFEMDEPSTVDGSDRR
jgi:ABC-type polysaccharide/polyol phosphate transport system ATPase subunit